MCNFRVPDLLFMRQHINLFLYNEFLAMHINKLGVVKLSSFVNNLTLNIVGGKLNLSKRTTHVHAYVDGLVYNPRLKAIYLPNNDIAFAIFR